MSRRGIFYFSLKMLIMNLSCCQWLKFFMMCPYWVGCMDCSEKLGLWEGLYSMYGETFCHLKVSPKQCTVFYQVGYKNFLVGIIFGMEEKQGQRSSIVHPHDFDLLFWQLTSVIVDAVSNFLQWIFMRRRGVKGHQGVCKGHFMTACFCFNIESFPRLCGCTMERKYH